MSRFALCALCVLLAATHFTHPADAAAVDEPIVIGHRGACGYVAEHTLESYAFAHAAGADYIEPDLVLTKDGRFICLHDIHLEDTTNVEDVFPSRKRDDGRWYAADFTLAEVKQLRAHERYSSRFPVDKLLFEVPTFEEMIQLVQGLNKSTGREAGIYPELKNPSWHERQGLPIEKAFLELAERYGYKGKDAKIFVQCFETASLEKMRNELDSELPQIVLVGGENPFQRRLTSEGLDEIATYANGIGPDKDLIEKNPGCVKLAHDRGLAVHPYTMRIDHFPKDRYETGQDEMRQFFFEYGVDGFFTDFPDVAVAVRDGGPKGE